MILDGFSGRALYTKELFRSCISLSQEARVLDIGIGPGWFLEMLGHECPSLKRFGIEYEIQSLNSFQKNIATNKDNLVQCSGVSLPFKDGAFESVNAFEVLEHIPPSTEINFFQEVARVLKPGGVFYMTTPNDSFISKLMDPAYILMSHRHYKSEFIKDLLIDNKLNLYVLRVGGGFYEYITTLGIYVWKHILGKEFTHMKFLGKKSFSSFLRNRGSGTIFVIAKK